MKMCEEYARRICKFKFADPTNPHNSEEQILENANDWKEDEQKKEFLERFNCEAKEDFVNFCDDFPHSKHDLEYVKKDLTFWRKVVRKTKDMH